MYFCYDVGQQEGVRLVLARAGIAGRGEVADVNYGKEKVENGRLLKGVCFPVG
jgi:hypothetical protein